MKTRYLTLALLASLTLGGCSLGPFSHRDSAPNVRVDVDRIPNATPRIEPLAKYGNMPSYEVFGKTYYPMKQSKNFIQRGIASWYGTKFHGRKTSSGEPYNMYSMTAAHKTLPLPTYVEVTNLDTGKQITVKVNDRGPFHDGRIIDLSYVAAMKLGITKTGTGNVEIRAIDPRNPTAHRDNPGFDGNIPEGQTLVVTTLEESGGFTATPIDAGTPIAAPTAVAVAAGSAAAGAAKGLTATPAPAPTSTPIQPAAIAAAPIPDTADDHVPGPTMFLQVGAFSSRLNAENLRSKLLQLSPEVHVTPVPEASTPVFRVRIGPLGSDAETEGLIARLPDFGITNHSVVVD